MCMFLVVVVVVLGLSGFVVVFVCLVFNKGLWDF